MSRGHHRSRSQFVSRFLERCQSRNAKNTIVIDDDVNHADVVVLDDSCSHHPSQKAQECLRGDVIFIDVEEDDTANSSGVGATNQSEEMSSSISSSNDSDSDELVVNSVHGNTCHGHSRPSRNCYGLGLDSECSMSESSSLKSDDLQCDDFEVSSSDCEIIEDDSSGNIREQWEKAASSRKLRRQSVSSDEDSSSGSYLSSPSIAETKDMHPEEQVILCEDNISNPGTFSQKHKPRDGCFTVLENDEEMQENPNENHSENSFSDKEKCHAGIDCNLQTCDMLHVSTDNGITQDKRERRVDVFYSSQQKPVTDHGVADFIGSKNSDYKELPIFSGQQEEILFSTENSNSGGPYDTNGIDKTDVVLKSSDVAQASRIETIEMLSNCTSLIGERERYKETDEYKRVSEEEWASRQKQLQFQAKEAQLLRKRRKAERIRALDVEKRQRQRLEEIRELQKKDVETAQMKEQIRNEVRKELDRMEMIYKDMASVLRALGIDVKGGYCPTLHEVNAACKQALVKFHPDRASRMDIRQQIEAEERFKLISRLKEKLADSSFRCV